MMQAWERKMRARVRRLSTEQAATYLARYREESKYGPTIHHDSVRELTNGLCSQTINFLTVRALHDCAAGKALS